MERNEGKDCPILDDLLPNCVTHTSNAKSYKIKLHSTLLISIIPSNINIFTTNHHNYAR